MKGRNDEGFSMIVGLWIADSLGIIYTAYGPECRRIRIHQHAINSSDSIDLGLYKRPRHDAAGK